MGKYIPSSPEASLSKLCCINGLFMLKKKNDIYQSFRGWWLAFSIHKANVSHLRLFLSYISLLFYQHCFTGRPKKALQGQIRKIRKYLPQIVVVIIFLFLHFITTIQYKEQNIFTYQGPRKLKQVEMCLQFLCMCQLFFSFSHKTEDLVMNSNGLRLRGWNNP